MIAATASLSIAPEIGIDRAALDICCRIVFRWKPVPIFQHGYSNPRSRRGLAWPLRVAALVPTSSANGRGPRRTTGLPIANRF